MSGGKNVAKLSPLQVAFEQLGSYEQTHARIVEMDGSGKPSIMIEAEKKQREMRRNVLAAMGMPQCLVTDDRVKPVFDDLAKVELKFANKKLEPIREANLWKEKQAIQNILETTCNMIMADIDLARRAAAGPAPKHARKEEPVAAGGARGAAAGPAPKRARKEEPVAAGGAAVDDDDDDVIIVTPVVDLTTADDA